MWIETQTSRVREPWFRDPVNSADVRHAWVTIMMLLLSDLATYCFCTEAGSM